MAERPIGEEGNVGLRKTRAAPSVRGVLAAAVAALGCLAAAPPEANAQGFFEELFGIAEAPASRPQAPASQRASRWQSSDERYRSTDWFAPEQPAAAPTARSSEARAAKRRLLHVHAVRVPARHEREVAEDEAPRAKRSGGSGPAFCVRMCDGRYFPLSSALSDDPDEAQQTCDALCPAAKTAVFRGSDPETARASDGTRYDELPVAFSFRERVVADCSCTGHGPGGLAALKLESDPTLQAGDIVMGQGGAAVFKGASRMPYRVADFTPIGSYAKVTEDLRRTLAGINSSSSVAQSAAVAIPVVAATEDVDAKPSRTRRTRERARAQVQRVAARSVRRARTATSVARADPAARPATAEDAAARAFPFFSSLW